MESSQEVSEELVTYKSVGSSDENLWSDADLEEIVSVPKVCAYDPLTRL